jgi:hypothetical protein
MKTRFAVSFAAMLLLAAVAAGAEQVSSGSTAPSPEAFIASLGCSAAPAAEATMSAAPAKPAVDVAPARTNLVVICGSCSVSMCRGAIYTTSCVLGQKRGSCIAALGNSCTDGSWQCQCWSGPLP